VLDQHLLRDPARVMEDVLHVEESGGCKNACYRMWVDECWSRAFCQVAVEQAEDNGDSYRIRP